VQGAEIAGEAVLQTFQPEHPVIRAILGGDEEAFDGRSGGASRDGRAAPWAWRGSC
jgi:primosomal protein N' (replication factor Y)